MNTNEGYLDCMNVIDLSFFDGGRSLQIKLRSSIPPYESTMLSVRNAFSIRMSHAPGDEYPYFVPEIRWRPIPKKNNAEVLHHAQYNFLDQQQNLLIVNRELLLLELEGAICGQVIAETIEYK